MVDMYEVPGDVLRELRALRYVAEAADVLQHHESTGRTSVGGIDLEILRDALNEWKALRNKEARNG